MKISPNYNHANQQLSFNGKLKKSPLVLKTLESFNQNELIELKEALKRANKVDDGKVFDIFAREENKYPLSRGFYVVHDFKELNQNKVINSEIVEDYGFMRRTSHEKNAIINILKSLKSIYPESKNASDIQTLKQEIKDLLI